MYLTDALKNYDNNDDEDKPAHLAIRDLLSLFLIVKLNQNDYKYWDGNVVYDDDDWC